MPWLIFTNNHSLQTANLKPIHVRDNAMAYHMIEIWRRRLMRGEVIVERARLVDDMHHFEQPFLKTALIDVMALFAWAGSYREDHPEVGGKNQTTHPC